MSHDSMGFTRIKYLQSWEFQQVYTYLRYQNGIFCLSYRPNTNSAQLILKKGLFTANYARTYLRFITSKIIILAGVIGNVYALSTMT